MVLALSRISEGSPKCCLMKSALSDEELAGMARNGDLGAFETLAMRWERKMFSLCYGIMGNPDDAQDALQEAMTSAFRTIGSFRGDSKFSSWMHRIAVNSCLTLKRKERRRAEDSFEHADGTTIEPIATGNDCNPSELSERGERVRFVRNAVASLPQEIRIAVIMKEFQELTFQEIADSLEIPVSTAKSRVYTGFKLLREKLAGKVIG